MRERDFGSYPSGLIYSFNILESWLYGGKPEANLQVGDIFEKLREKADQGYFEELLRAVYLDNDHRCEVIMEPSRRAGEERERQRNGDFGMRKHPGIRRRRKPFSVRKENCRNGKRKRIRRRICNVCRT